MTNVRIDPCNQSGETVMGRRAVMRVDPVSGVSGWKQCESVGDLRGLASGCSLTIPARVVAYGPDEHCRPGIGDGFKSGKVARPLHDRTNPGR